VNDLLLQIIVIAVVANVVLVLLAIIVPRLRRGGREDGTVGGGAPAGVAPAGVSSMTPAMAASGTTALSASAGVPYAATMPGSPASPEEPETAPMRDNIDDGARPRRFVMPQEDDYPTSDSVEAFLAGPGPQPVVDERFDEETGLPTEPVWDEVVRLEEARLSRYGRPATVIVAELDRLDALAARIGRENADRLIPPVAAVLRRQGRQADVITRTGRARFQILLPETDEVAAINYVERVRSSCDIWLEAAAISVRLVMGWASAAAGGTLQGALRVAEQRMHADRARGTHGRNPGAPGAPTTAGGQAGAPAATPGAGMAPAAEPLVAAPPVDGHPGVTPDSPAPSATAEEPYLP
jgi:diguanylate cyclase (GGDEF)-like protein